MPSYFLTSTDKDLDNLFIPRTDTILGAPSSPSNAFYSNNAVLESKYVRYSELGLAEPTTPLIALTGFKSSAKDLSYIYIPLEDERKICSYLTSDGLIKYEYGRTLWIQYANESFYGGYGSPYTTWKDIKFGAGATAILLQTNNSLWKYSRYPEASVTQIGTSTDWSSITSSSNSFTAVKTNGTLWTWGDNTYGQLGINDVTYRLNPTQVGTLTNWKQLGAKGYYYTDEYGAVQYTSCIAVKTNGTLWAWGYNGNGQLGLNDIASRSSPVQVGTLTNWNSVDATTHVLAIKTDGTLWSWGSNGVGQLGKGDVVKRSSPVQVGTLTDWSKISAGISNSAAIKTDGTLWTWGIGTYGVLGLGATIARSSPVQVGSLTNWALVDTNTVVMIALKTDGTLWTWGDVNYLGKFYSSPVQIGTDNDWVAISASSKDGVAAIKNKVCT